jgi:hypothetical protein
MPKELYEKVLPYLGKGEPMLKMKSEFARVMTRKLDTGRLYFIFNEGIEPICEKITIDAKRLYNLSVRDGEVYSFDGNAEIKTGEILVVLATDEELETVSDKAKESFAIEGFTPVSHRRFTVDHFGISSVFGEGAPKEDATFSGEIRYETDYKLPFEPRADERYRIALDGFDVSATVELGEKTVSLGMTPMRAVISGKDIAKEGRIAITVANTPTNEISAKQHIINSFPAAEIGSYAEKLAILESHHHTVTFGKVTLEKL